MASMTNDSFVISNKKRIPGFIHNLLPQSSQHISFESPTISNFKQKQHSFLVIERY